MRSLNPISHLWSASLVVVGSLVGCNLHSGSGLDPDEILDSGSDGEPAGQDAEVTGSSSGGTGGGSGGSSSGGMSSSGTSSGTSSGGSGSGSGSDVPDAAPPVDATVDVNGSCESDAGACLSCCIESYSAEMAAFEKVAQGCLCGASGACSADCTNEFCNLQPFATANDPCQLCIEASLSPSGSCGQECAGAGCEQVATCLVGCPAQAQ
jgi:hypothetical protein